MCSHVVASCLARAMHAVQHSVLPHIVREYKIYLVLVFLSCKQEKPHTKNEAQDKTRVCNPPAQFEQ